ncbi:MAG TPA: formate dehydrogenase accessory protein FdhE [Nitrospirota bacterium]|nr:formate dehydrogenase accessory protein FdhE [Nitrospirota bacterium]
MNTETRILEPGQLETPPAEIRFLFLPKRDVFKRRAERLRLLSGNHTLGDYLNFLAMLADAQQVALDKLPAPSLPDSGEQMRCREHGIPPLNAASRRRDPAWRQGLTVVLKQMHGAALPSAARDSVNSLMQMSEAVLEGMADNILTGKLSDISPQELPFVAAGLQVSWVAMASSLKEDAVGRLEHGGLCPVCGSHPGVGIVRINGQEQGLRYLSCSLCSSQWHMVRLKCSICESTEGIDYHTLEGSKVAVKTESCDKCNYYLKLLYLEKDPHMEATADDLATLALDMLMDKEGKARGGPNLYFHPGKPH